MRLTILGGGGFRVPLVYGAVLAADSGIDEVALHDTSSERLEVMAQVLNQQASGAARQVPVIATTNLDQVLDGAGFVFSAMRVGGLAGRVQDERIALDAGCLGQETTGPGGIAYGLRTVPVARRLAERIASRAPRAWCINFTNPAGMITQAMREVLGDRVTGICDSPVGLVRRAAGALGVAASAAGYVGLNHLGWLRELRVDGTDRLPDLIADRDALLGTEEGRLFGPAWIQALGAIPNEYLYYYYFTREAVRAIRGSARTRGEFLLDQQESFYARARAESAQSYALWLAARREREETYLAESRGEGEKRDEADLSGGYEGVALALMKAILRDEPSTLILNVRNGNSIDGLPADAVVEVPCDVDGSGVHPRPAATLDAAMLGLCQQVKAVDELTIAAALAGDSRLALKAFALHPLVDSVGTARVLLDEYRSRIPEIGALF